MIFSHTCCSINSILYITTHIWDELHDTVVTTGQKNIIVNYIPLYGRGELSVHAR